MEEYRFTDDLYITKSIVKLIEHLINIDLNGRDEQSSVKLTLK